MLPGLPHKHTVTFHVCGQSMANSKLMLVIDNLFLNDIKYTKGTAYFLSEHTLRLGVGNTTATSCD